MNTTQIIKLSPESITKEDFHDLSAWLLTYPQLSQGELVAQFESAFEEKFAKPYGKATYVNSGSSANLLALYALSLNNHKNKKYVVVPALSWITDLSPVIQLGFTPILCDCNWDNLSLDLYHLEEICKKYNPFAVISVSVLGMDYDRKSLLKLANSYDFFIIADECESLGLKDVSKYSHISTYSFYYSHHMSTVEGGMCLTEYPNFDFKLKSMRNHGWCRGIKMAEKLLKATKSCDDFSFPFTFYYPGFNFRNTEEHAFLGVKKLKTIDGIIEQRRLVRNYYNHFLDLEKKHFYNTVVKYADEKYSPFAVPLVFKKKEEREKIIAALKDVCELRPLIAGSLSKQPVYDIMKIPRITRTPFADIIHENGLYLPCHEEMSFTDVEKICQTIRRTI